MRKSSNLCQELLSVLFDTTFLSKKILIKYETMRVNVLEISEIFPRSKIMNEERSTHFSKSLLRRNGSLSLVRNNLPNRTIRPTSTRSRSLTARYFLNLRIFLSSPSTSFSLITDARSCSNLAQCSSTLR